MTKRKVTKKQKSTIYWCICLPSACILWLFGGIIGVLASVIVSNMIVDNFFEVVD